MDLHPKGLVYLMLKSKSFSEKAIKEVRRRGRSAAKITAIVFPPSPYHYPYPYPCLSPSLT